MQFSIKKLLALLLLTSALLAVGLPVLAVYFFVTGPGHEDHYIGLGTDFPIQSFHITNANGDFRLTQGELTKLDAECAKQCFECVSPIAQEIDAVGQVSQFKSNLSDGFQIESESKFCSATDGRDYLQLELCVDDEFGFQADFYFLRIDMQQVLSMDRLDDLRALFPSNQTLD